MAEPVRYFSAETGHESGPEYRPLSLLALLGFGVSALYAGVIGVTILVAFLSGKPLLLSLWSLGPPLAAVGLCGVAWLSIRSSEGTLAGAALVRWGVLLVLFVGLGYWAYYFAVYFAVRQQSRNFAETFLKTLQEGNIKQATYYVVPPLRRRSLRENDPELHFRVDELLANQFPGPDYPRSAYLNIQQNRMVRLLGQSKDFTYEFKGVRAWTFINGGYEVLLDYLLTTPEGTFEGQLAVTGREAPHNEYPGRQWFIEIEANKTQILEGGELSRVTDKGRELARVQLEAALFTRQIREPFERGDRLPIFLMTLPEAERKKAGEELRLARQRAAAGGFAALLTTPSSDLASRYSAFLEGNLLSVDPDFVPDPAKQAELLKTAQRFFRQPDLRIRVEQSQSSVMPYRTTKDGRLVMSFDVALSELNGLVSEGFVDVEELPGGSWRLKGFRLCTQKVHAPRSPQRTTE